MNHTEVFHELISDILSLDEVQNMHNLRQHTDTCTLLEHSIYTAYITYRMCNAFGLKTTEAVRAAVLHDFRLSDHAKNSKFLAHSTIAEELAGDFFELSKLQRNIISSHMWPINITKLPKSREAIVVNLADNYCAILEKLQFSKRTKVSKKLNLMIANPAMI